jgi:predicted nucleic acid-binding Zn ribbon protein
MAMTICKECGKEISEDAKVCPHCGAVQKRSPSFLLIIGILFIPIIFVWFTLRKGYSGLTRFLSFGYLIGSMVFMANIGDSIDRVEATQSSNSGTAMEVSISKMVSDYDRNEVAADAKYKDKIVKFSGPIGEIKKDLLDNIYITVGRPSDTRLGGQVQAFFNDSMAGELAQLSQGSYITLACKIDGLMMNVLASECIIVK